MTTSKRRGLARFVDGRFGLERIIAATQADPDAMREIGKQRVARLRDDRVAEQRRIAERRGA